MIVQADNRKVQSILERTNSLWNEAEIQRISRSLGEPQSLLSLRLKAFEQFKKTPWPTSLDESWRRNEPQRIGKSRFPLGDSSGIDASVEIHSQNEEPVAAKGTHLHLHNFKVIAGEIAPSQSEHGLQAGSLHDGFRNNSAKVLESASQTIPNDNDSPALSYLHSAFFQGGVFCIVPENWSSPRSIILDHRLSHSGKALFSKNILSIGKDSRATIMLRQEDISEIDSWLGVFTQVTLEDNARLDLIVLNKSGALVNLYDHLNVTMGRDSIFNLTWFDDTRGWTVMRREVEMQKKGSEARLRGANIGGGDSHYDLRSLQNHSAPSTFSDLMFKAVNFDRSKSVYQGLIKVNENALNANAYQLNRNLLMSAEARADSIPKLEILVDEVKCTHGASAGKPDPNSMFYLKSRGIPENEAARLIVEGFLNETGEMIDDNQLFEYWQKAVFERLNGTINKIDRKPV